MASPTNPLRRWLSTAAARRIAWLLVSWLVIEFVYLVVVSAGQFSEWPPQMRFYDQQAEAFRRGQLHLPLEPNPILSRVPDPYHIKHARYWVMDFSYFEGRYYLYWGPVPAAILAFGKSVFGVEGSVADCVLAFGFTSLLALVGLLLVRRVAEVLFPDLSRGLVTMSALAFALSAPLLHGVASGSVYVAAITGGQAFLWLGLYLAFEALVSKKPPWAWLAGLAFALAIGCRVSLSPAIALIGFAFAFIASARELSVRNVARWLLPMGAPCAAMMALLLLYNYARFDRFLEFGTGVQLSAWKFRASSEYVLANLHSYLFRPWRWSCEFPYLLQGKGIAQAAPPSFLGVPKDYATVSPLVGLLWGVPILWLVPALILLGWSALRRGARNLTRELRSESGERPRLLGFCLVAFAVAGSVTGFPELGLNVATMRYEADVSSGLFLLGLLGLWMLVTRFGGAPSRTVWRGALAKGLAHALLTATISIGLLMGYQGYSHHFAKHNPALHRGLVETLSACPAPR